MTTTDHERHVKLEHRALKSTIGEDWSETCQDHTKPSFEAAAMILNYIYVLFYRTFCNILWKHSINGKLTKRHFKVSCSSISKKGLLCYKRQCETSQFLLILYIRSLTISGDIEEKIITPAIIQNVYSRQDEQLRAPRSWGTEIILTGILIISFIWSTLEAMCTYSVTII